MEEQWWKYKLEVLKDISTAASTDARENAIAQRISDLAQTWEDKPNHPASFKDIEDGYFWAVYHNLDADGQTVMDKAVTRAKSSNRKLSGLHILQQLIYSKKEITAHTLLLLVGFEYKKILRAFHAELLKLDYSNHPVQITPDLEECLKAWSLAYHESATHTGSLLGAMIDSRSFAYDFLKDACDIELLSDLIKRVR